MTQPVFTPLPIGNPPTPTDNRGQEIKIGSPIAYAVSDGYLHTGVVRDIIHKVVDHWDYSTTPRQKVPGWSTRLKVEVERDKTYSGSMRHVSLTKLGNIIVLDSATGPMLTKQIEDSWLDAD